MPCIKFSGGTVVEIESGSRDIDELVEATNGVPRVVPLLIGVLGL